MLHIRPYSPQDRSAVEKICVPQQNDLSETLLNCFCRYYIDQEADNCFVCLEDDTICGYILCSENFHQWKKQLIEHHANADPISFAIATATIDNLRPYAAQYPAHLHIDFVPNAQGKGYGTSLISHLCTHLRQKNIPGLMLDVSVDNIGAQRFYQRNGFTVLGRNDNSIQMGRRL